MPAPQRPLGDFSDRHTKQVLLQLAPRCSHVALLLWVLVPELGGGASGMAFPLLLLPVLPVRPGDLFRWTLSPTSLLSGHTGGKAVFSGPNR